MAEYSTVQVAKKLGIGADTLHRWIREGLMPPKLRRIGNVRIRLWTEWDLKRARSYSKVRSRKKTWLLPPRQLRTLERQPGPSKNTVSPKQTSEFLAHFLDRTLFARALSKVGDRKAYFAPQLPARQKITMHISIAAINMLHTVSKKLGITPRSVHELAIRLLAESIKRE